MKNQFNYMQLIEEYEWQKKCHFPVSMLRHKSKGFICRYPLILIFLVIFLLN